MLRDTSSAFAADLISLFAVYRSQLLTLGVAICVGLLANVGRKSARERAVAFAWKRPAEAECVPHMCTTDIECRTDSDALPMQSDMDGRSGAQPYHPCRRFRHHHRLRPLNRLQDRDIPIPYAAGHVRSCDTRRTRLARLEADDVCSTPTRPAQLARLDHPGQARYRRDLLSRYWQDQ